MKTGNIITLCLSILTATVFHTAELYGKDNTKLTFNNINVVHRNDSIHISFRLTAQKGALKTNEALMIIPMIQAPAGNTELPGILINGKRRAGFYKRELNFRDYYEMPEIAPAEVLTLKRNPVHTDYKYTIPASQSIDGGNLYFYEHTYNCCSGNMEKSAGILAESLMNKLEKATEPDPIKNDAVTHIQAEYEEIKHREASLKSYLNFRVNKYDIITGIGNNKKELARIDSAISPFITKEDFFTVKSVHVSGYASPEGSWKSNEVLAYNRALNFWQYLASNYKIKGLSRENVTIVSFSEDWKELAELVRNSNIHGKEEALAIIEGNDDFDARELKLKKLSNGLMYKYILENYYPLLRRMEISFQYNVRGLTDEEAINMLKTNPTDLSLYEIYRAYTLQGLKSDKIYLLAVSYFPENPIAIINAASVFLAKNDLPAAWDYLKLVQDDARAFNNIGLYYMLNSEFEKAEDYLEKAKASDSVNAEQNLAQLQRFIEQKKAQENYSPVYQYKRTGM